MSEFLAYRQEQLGQRARDRQRTVELYQEGVTPLAISQELAIGYRVVTSTMYAIYIVSVEVAIVSFILAVLLYYILGYPGYLVLAIWTGLSMFIPIVGPLVVMVYFILYNLATGNIPGVFIALFIIYPILLWLPGSYIRPRLMGKRVSIHPVLMMIGIIGGISIMGIIGLILGPLFIALLVSSYRILIDQLTLAKHQAVK
jgi:predicted PurR-regulated permease PerM